MSAFMSSEPIARPCWKQKYLRGGYERTHKSQLLLLLHATVMVKPNGTRIPTVDELAVQPGSQTISKFKLLLIFCFKKNIVSGT
jgi:hypothetical protein